MKRRRRQKKVVFQGKIERTRDGYGFLLREGGEDIFIPAHFMKGALSGDIAIVQILRRPRVGKLVGMVKEIVKARDQEFIGTLRREGNKLYIITDERSLPSEISLHRRGFRGAKDGDKVVFKVISRRRRLYAEIKGVLGNSEDPKIDIIVVKKRYQLPQNFSNGVMEMSNRIAVNIEKEKKKRLDLRDEVIFTIDPEDAKDFDDAISIDFKDGYYKLGVHIADVSHFVKEREGVDLEAKKRGTSVYLIDEVIPMLPPRLSENLASLIPGKDRLAVSVLIKIDKRGDVIEYNFFNSIIKSKKRLTYEEAEELLKMGKGTLAKKLYIAKELSDKLREKRYKRGSLDFDLPEPYITLLPSGYVESIGKKKRLSSHKIIEDFMILTNEVIAQTFSEKEVPCIYRVHNKPTLEKLKELSRILIEIADIKINPENPLELQRVLLSSEDMENGDFIRYLLLRSLPRAEYSVENIGHFGLGSSAYLHFTSPIRRYPDLTIHRILKNLMENRINTTKKWRKEMRLIAKHSTEMENAAEKAEMNLVRFKELEFMKTKLGEIFEGIITHLTNQGFFVEVKEFLIEGFVNIDSLQGYYRYLPEDYIFINRKEKRVIKLGEKVVVKVVNVDKDRGKIDFVLVS